MKRKPLPSRPSITPKPLTGTGCDCRRYRIGCCPCEIDKEERFIKFTFGGLGVFIAICFIVAIACSSGNRISPIDQAINCIESGGKYHKELRYCERVKND